MNRKRIAVGLLLVLTLTCFAAGAADTPYTLVLDAGHGGFDGGAVGADGTTEQNINLSIVQRTAALAGFFGIPTVLTRTDTQALDYDPSRAVRENKTADLRARVRITEQVPNAVFCSVHLNKFSDAQYHGAQVFYSRNNEHGKPLAEAMQAALCQGCDPKNHRKAKQAENTIYLMKKLTCPAVIAECGFLSNTGEAARLRDERYHTRLALCLICGYLRFAGAI